MGNRCLAVFVIWGVAVSTIPAHAYHLTEEDTLASIATVFGAAVTTFLLVAAGTIQAVTAVVGGDSGPWIAAMLVGALAGLIAVAAVLRWWPKLD